MNKFAKKRLGQNFLIDPNILRKIAEAINPQKDEEIIEIGPGRGALTEYLLEAGAIVHAIELDDDLIPELKMKFEKYENFNLYHSDALKFDFSQIFHKGKKVKYTGNVPYNITSPLLEIAYKNAEYIKGVYFLVQKEFAKRITAHAGNKDYGILSVLSQYFGVPRIHFDVSPNVFRPVPRVTSSFFSILFNNNEIDYDLFESIRNTVKVAFNKRRKTLRNSIKSLLPENYENCPINLGKRPEQLNLDEFKLLVNFLDEN